MAAQPALQNACSGVPLLLIFTGTMVLGPGLLRQPALIKIGFSAFSAFPAFGFYKRALFAIGNTYKPLRSGCATNSIRFLPLYHRQVFRDNHSRPITLFHVP